MKCALLNACGSCMQCIIYLKTEIWGKIFQQKCKCKASVLCIFAVGAMCRWSSDQSNYTISTAILTLANSETWAFCLCICFHSIINHILCHTQGMDWVSVTALHMAVFPFLNRTALDTLLSIVFLIEFLIMSDALMVWLFGRTGWLTR